MGIISVQVGEAGHLGKGIPRLAQCPHPTLPPRPPHRDSVGTPPPRPRCMQGADQGADLVGPALLTHWHLDLHLILTNLVWGRAAIAPHGVVGGRCHPVSHQFPASLFSWPWRTEVRHRTPEEGGRGSRSPQS